MYLLIISTLVGFLSVYSSQISNFIFRWCNRATRREKLLFEERCTLKAQQETLSNVRDFVQFSKLQRKINKIDQELSEIRSNKAGNLMVNIVINYSLKAFLAMVAVFIMLFYRKVPVFIVDMEYDLFPFTGLISFPNDYVNSVSVHFWMICCSSVAKLITS